jgi:hypothetical protein
LEINSPENENLANILVIREVPKIKKAKSQNLSPRLFLDTPSQLLIKRNPQIRLKDLKQYIC